MVAASASDGAEIEKIGQSTHLLWFTILLWIKNDTEEVRLQQQNQLPRGGAVAFYSKQTFEIVLPIEFC